MEITSRDEDCLADAGPLTSLSSISSHVGDLGKQVGLTLLSPIAYLLKL